MSAIRTRLLLPLSVLGLVVAAVTIPNGPGDAISPAERAQRALIAERRSLEVIRARINPYKGRTPKRALTPAEIDPYKYGPVDFAGSPPNKILCIYFGGTWIKGHPDPAYVLAGAHGHCFDWKVTL